MLEILEFLFQHYFITIILAYMFVMLISDVVRSITRIGQPHCQCKKQTSSLEKDINNGDSHGIL